MKRYPKVKKVSSIDHEDPLNLIQNIKTLSLANLMNNWSPELQHKLWQSNCQSLAHEVPEYFGSISESVKFKFPGCQELVQFNACGKNQMCSLFQRQYPTSFTASLSTFPERPLPLTIVPVLHTEYETDSAQYFTYKSLQMRDDLNRKIIDVLKEYSKNKGKQHLKKSPFETLKKQLFLLNTTITWTTISPVLCQRGHILLEDVKDDGWPCDGRHEQGGCKRGITGRNQTKGIKRYRCKTCDYDICDACFESKGGTAEG
jgi:hypothetical protein